MQHKESVRGTQPRRPAEVEQNGDTIYIRSGIVWVDATNDEETSHWEYSEAQMDVTERDALKEGRLSVDTDPLRRYERQLLHEATDGEVTKALRKIREGDTTHDWAGWLALLDAYNVAIEQTKEQPEYPIKVVYPEYPVRPW